MGYWVDIAKGRRQSAMMYYTGSALKARHFLSQNPPVSNRYTRKNGIIT